MDIKAGTRPKVLCVDDEVRVVEGLATLLRKGYEVHIASSGELALQKLREVRGLAVVISDMRMPSMDGATFLHEMARRCPDATRILLTGHAELEAAKRAVNEGQIFRFLTKPCPFDELKAAIDAGVTHHHLVTAERSVLRETLIGCIRALMDVLAMSNPVAFGRANGIKRLAVDLAAKLGYPEFWQLEAAALLSQVGYLSLPPELAEKLYYGRALTPAEQSLAASTPGVAKKLLEHIPRLEPVMQILDAVKATDAQLAALGEGPIGVGARVLGLTLEFDVLTAQSQPKDAVLGLMRARMGRYGPAIIEQLGILLDGIGEATETQDVTLRSVQPGMKIMQDVRNHFGVLVVPKGFEVSQSFIERINNFAADLLELRVRVTVPRPHPVGVAA
jgi:response regulator RpfG family c-di-GMP phosphodiesterase